MFFEDSVSLQPCNPLLERVNFATVMQSYSWVAGSSAEKKILPLQMEGSLRRKTHKPLEFTGQLCFTCLLFDEIYTQIHRNRHK